MALAVVRFLHFAPLMILFGGALYGAALARAPISDEIGAHLRRWAPALATLALASGLVWFWLVAREMAGDDFGLEALEDVAFETAFGKVWWAHVALLAGLVLAARGGRRTLAVVAGLSVATLALTGHAAMQEGALGAMHRANHALHLLTTAAWIGGLPPFLLCLKTHAPARPDALQAMMRYSKAGHFAVPLVLLTGALDAAITTGPPPWRTFTPYRVGLAAKAAIYFAMTALALINRYLLAPRAGRDSRAARALALGAWAEIALGLCALADVSRFALLDPT